MALIILNVIFLLTAIAMIVLILLQRGAGAAGGGFGGGASATVFGARGSSNFLSKATKWCAFVVFSISLGLAWYASKGHTSSAANSSLGVMSAAENRKPQLPSGSPAQPSVPVPGNSAPSVPSPTPTMPAPATPTNGEPSLPSPSAALPTVPTPGGPTNTSPPAPQPTPPAAKPGKGG